MAGLYEMVRRIEELGGEIKSADAIVLEDTLHRDRAKRVFEQQETKLVASIKLTVDKRAERDAIAARMATEALKSGEPLDPNDHTPMIVEENK